jgi:hypothetical protein
MTSIFNWRDQSSDTGKDLGRKEKAVTTHPAPITYSKQPSHYVRKSEAQKVGSTSRNPTASINTEPAASELTSKAAI